MFNSTTQSHVGSSFPKAAAPGSIPQPRPDGVPHDTVPDWNAIGLFTAGIAVGAILGATVALLMAPGSGEQTRETIARRVRRMRGGDDVWDELAEELERAASEKEESPTKITVET